MQAPLRGWHACTLVTRDPADDASGGREERGHDQLPGPAWLAWFVRWAFFLPKRFA
jgi:hypothetical protein